MSDDRVLEPDVTNVRIGTFDKVSRRVEFTIDVDGIARLDLLFNQPSGDRLFVPARMIVGMDGVAKRTFSPDAAFEARLCDLVYHGFALKLDRGRFLAVVSHKRIALALLESTRSTAREVVAS